jgi:hypothetical protein
MTSNMLKKTLNQQTSTNQPTMKPSTYKGRDGLKPNPHQREFLKPNKDIWKSSIHPVRESAHQSHNWSDTQIFKRRNCGKKAITPSGLKYKQKKKIESLKYKHKSSSSGTNFSVRPPAGAIGKWYFAKSCQWNMPAWRSVIS